MKFSIYLNRRVFVMTGGFFFGCHMAGNVMCFRSDEEDMKIPGPVADSRGCHISPKPGSDLGPWN